MVHCAAYDCLMVVGRPKAFFFYKFQADSQRRKQAVMTNHLRASSSKTTPKLLKSLGLESRFG